MPHTPGFPAIPGLYGISVTAELSGFTIATLRLYEQHGLITPARTRGGTRRYSDADLTRLSRIAELIGDGINLVGIGRVLELEAHTASLQQDNQRLTRDNTELRKERNSAMTSIPHAAHDATPDVDRVEQTITIDGDALDNDPITIDNDAVWPAPEGDLIEQSIPAPVDDY
ncbi:MerR family transcriptional regulator [Rhodococcus erythropolis]|uniref:MerR family transcriptional regulator n=1 Tax=Rhodococcus erythropolis TaxID=1833 RepID=UPI0009BFF244|nr:MerR family transcriptional regulator [Rhodococcus erythropolis]